MDRKILGGGLVVLLVAVTGISVIQYLHATSSDTTGAERLVSPTKLAHATSAEASPAPSAATARVPAIKDGPMANQHDAANSPSNQAQGAVAPAGWDADPEAYLNQGMFDAGAAEMQRKIESTLMAAVERGALPQAFAVTNVYCRSTACRIKPAVPAQDTSQATNAVMSVLLEAYTGTDVAIIVPAAVDTLYLARVPTG